MPLSTPHPQQDMVGRQGSEKVAKMSSGRSLSSLPAPHCSVQSAAVAERERVSRLFAEAAAVLQGFQTDVLGFIDEGEAGSPRPTSLPSPRHSERAPAWA